MGVKDLSGMDLENRYDVFLAAGLLCRKRTYVSANTLESVSEHIFFTSSYNSLFAKYQAKPRINWIWV